MLIPYRDNDGLHLFPFTRKPYAIVKGLYLLPPDFASLVCLLCGYNGDI
jgi:hypothetical protein